MFKYINLKDLSNLKFNNILLIIDESEFRQLSKEEIYRIFNYSVFANIYWIFIYGNNALDLEEEIDFLIEEYSLVFNDDSLLNIVTTSYNVNDTEELLSDLYSCLTKKNIKFNCLISKKLKDVIKIKR
jgi:hypothetical protein